MNFVYYMNSEGKKTISDLDRNLTVRSSQQEPLQGSPKTFIMNYYLQVPEISTKAVIIRPVAGNRFFLKNDYKVIKR